MPTIVQSKAGDPTDLFFSGREAQGTGVFDPTADSFFWGEIGEYNYAGLTQTGLLGGVYVGGSGFVYTGNQLASTTKVTTLEVRYYDPFIAGVTIDGKGDQVVTFSGLSLSAGDTKALLQGDTNRLDNIIAANPWNYLGSSGADTFISGSFDDSLNGGNGDDHLYGSGGNDVIQGGAGIDLIFGGAGDDRIDGGPGDTDFMFGGKGDDRFYVDNNSEGVRENSGEGHDSVYSTGDFMLYTTAAVELLSVRDRNANLAIDLTGNAFSQTIVGGISVNVLDGRGGNDVLEGGQGADQLIGGTGVDTATYSRAASGVTVSLANPAINTGEAAGDTFDSVERLIGSTFSDRLNGSNGVNNTIDGGAGNDILKGYTGNDALYGGAGKDFFVFNTALDAVDNVDIIADFSAAADTIQLDNAVFTKLTATGALAASAFKDIAIAIKDANDRIIYNSDTGALYYDADGSGSAFGNIKFAALTGSPSLTAADFVVI